MPSDPITFFSPSSLWHKPDWMKPPVGPDVSPELRWYPVVTFLQLGLDMAIALAVPIGPRAPLCAGALHRRLGGGDRPAGVDAGGDRAVEGARQGVRRGLRWLVGAAAVAGAVALAVAGNSLALYRGWAVERLEPAALSAKLAPYYRVMRPAGEGPFPTALLYLGVRRAARQPRSAGRGG